MSALMPMAFTGVIDCVVDRLICIYLQAKKDARHSSKKMKSDSARACVSEYNILRGLDVYPCVEGHYLKVV